MDVYVHTEVIERMNPDEKYQLLQEAEYLADNCEARITISQTSGFKHIFNVLTGRDLAYRRQIELDSNQLNKIILSILRILYDDVLNIQNEQLSIEERLTNLERNVALVMSIQRKMLDKLSNNDQSDMMQLSEMLKRRLEEERNRNLKIPSQYQNENNAIPLNNSNQILNQPKLIDVNVNNKKKTFWSKIQDEIDSCEYRSKYEDMCNSEIIGYIMSKDNNKYIKKNGIIYYIDIDYDESEINEYSSGFYCLGCIKDDGISDVVVLYIGTISDVSYFELYFEGNRLYFEHNSHSRKYIEV